MKVQEKNQFLHETPSQTEIGDLIKQLVTINNLRVKIDLLSMFIEELMKHGPLKPQELRGLKETVDLDKDIEDKYKVPKPQMPPQVGTKYNEDKSAQRTGWILEEDVTNLVMKAVSDARDYISLKRAEAKQLTTLDDLVNHLDLLKGAVMIAYPAYHGLPEWEPCRVVLEDKLDILQKDESNQDYYQLDTTLLWYAGKELERGKLLSDYVGKNEKTKIVVKFSKKGTGAPMREPLIDKDTHSKMLAYYFKKQEEQKALENENEDSYLNSSWADPKGFKKSLHSGNKDVTWKFK